MSLREQSRPSGSQGIDTGVDSREVDVSEFNPREGRGNPHL
jgi:hypothetical protein